MVVNISQILDEYTSHLSFNYPRHLKKFELLKRNSCDAAKFEAVCYSILLARNIEVKIGEECRTGGADFLCSTKIGKFAVEATTINTFSMEDKTGMKNDQMKISGDFYCAYPTLYQKLEDKTRQLSKYEFPGIVAIGSFHNESLTLFRHVMVDEYLNAFFCTDAYGNLKHNDALKNISAFMLIGFGHNEYSIMGFLNPKPAYHFSIRSLPDINFRRVTQMGLDNKTGEGEWVKSENGSIEPSIRYPLQSLRSKEIMVN